VKITCSLCSIMGLAKDDFWNGVLCPEVKLK